MVKQRYHMAGSSKRLYEVCCLLTSNYADHIDFTLGSLLVLSLIAELNRNLIVYVHMTALMRCTHMLIKPILDFTHMDVGRLC